MSCLQQSAVIEKLLLKLVNWDGNKHQEQPAKTEKKKNLNETGRSLLMQNR